MKRFLTSILCLVLLASLLVVPALGASNMASSETTKHYELGRFSDVASGAWYESGVSVAYAYGLLKGTSENSFGIGTNMKLSEAVTLAARLYSIYHDGSGNFPDTEPWYQAYVDYAVENGIISDQQFKNYEAMATRLQFVELMAAALPDEAFPVINSIETGEIPDISLDAPHDHIYKFYRAGILTGKTEDGHFYPVDLIMREEVAAIVARIAAPGLREIFAPLLGSGSWDELSGTIRLAIMAAINATGNCRMARHNPSTSYGQPLYTVNKLIPVISERIAEAISYTKDRPELKEVIEQLETARLVSVDIRRLVPALGASSSSDEWDAAIDVLKGCTDALKRAEGAL